jgi:ribosomal protein S8
MHLNIDIDTHKSNLFLDLLNVLKEDNMINDFQIVQDTRNLSSYEKDLLQDIEQISTTIQNANNGQGIKKDISLNF